MQANTVVASRRIVIGLGLLATFGAFIGVLADIFSAWSPDTSHMATALSVELDNIVGLYANKPRWTYVLGNYLGVYFIPLHSLGFFLVFQALKPANANWARLFLSLAIYFTAIGVGMHGTLAFVGDIVRSGNAGLLEHIRDYWQPWAYSLAVGYVILSTLLLMLILTGRSYFPRWTASVSPIALLVYSSILIAILPDSATSLKAFLSLTGLNLPLLVFFPITTWFLARRSDLSFAM